MRDFPTAFEQISLDRDNTALVITGSGDSFMDQIDGPSLGEIFKPAVWEKIRTEGAKVLQRLLELPLPVVGGGDGLHVVWEEIVGTARAKWLLWTGEQINAQTALQWGVVSEVVPHERALERRLVQDVPCGMALEGLTAA